MIGELLTTTGLASSLVLGSGVALVWVLILGKDDAS